MPPETLEAPPAANDSAFAEADAALDQLQGVTESGEPAAAPPAAAPAPPAAPAAPVEPPKTAEAKKQEPESDDDIPTAPKAKVESKPADPKPEPKGKKGESLSEFRKEYEATKAERDQLKAQIEATKIEREKLLDEGRKAAAKELAAELEAHKKQLADMDFELRCANYVRSKEYKEKFEQPLKTAWEKAVKAVTGMKLVDANGQEREVSANDIYHLTQMEEIPAWQRANELFGNAAAAVMKHRDKIMELEESRNAAIKDYREKGSAREAEMAKQREASEAEKLEMFENHLSSERQTYADVFGEHPTDAKATQWWKKGLAWAEKGILGKGIPEGITPQERVSQRVQAQAKVFNWAAAFPKERYLRLQAEAEIESLKAKLASFQKSEPEPAQPKDHAPAGQEGDIDHEFNKHFGV